MTIPLHPARGRRRRPHAADHLAPYRWRPGQSGGGQDAVSALVSLATQIRRASGEGAELVAFYFAVLRGEPFAVVGTGRRQHPTLDQRLVAAAWPTAARAVTGSVVFAFPLMLLFALADTGEKKGVPLLTIPAQ